jgi:hypothetical protein
MSRQTSLFLIAVITSSFIFSACEVPGLSKREAPVGPDGNLPKAAPADSEPVSGENTQQAEGTSLTVITSYQSPAAEEMVSFSLTVDREGVITSGTTEVLAKNPTSIQRQTAFAAEFPTALTGKKLTELEKVDRIGGSSLTTGAFNKALADFKAQL